MIESPERLLYSREEADDERVTRASYGPYTDPYDTEGREPEEEELLDEASSRPGAYGSGRGSGDSVSYQGGREGMEEEEVGLYREWSSFGRILGMEKGLHDLGLGLGGY